MPTFIRQILRCSLALMLSLPVQADEVRPLRVAMFAGSPPMVFQVSGQLQGIEVDLAKELASNLDRPLEVKQFPFPDLLKAVADGEVDIAMSGISITPERTKLVKFTKPYMDVGQMAIVRLENVQKFGKVDALELPSIKIGVQRGGTGEGHVLENYAKANVISFSGVEEGLAALRDGMVDVYVHDSTTSWHLRRSFVNDNLISLNRFLTQESIGWAVNSDNHELLVAVNLILEKLKNQGRVSEIITEWLPGIPAVSR